MWYYYFPYSGLVNAITSVGLGFFILSRNYKSSINRGYALFAFAVGFWAFNYFIWLMSKQYDQALFFIRLTMIGPFFIPAAFVYFVTSLLSIRKKYLHLGNAILITIFTLFSFSPIYIKNVKPQLFFSFWPVPGLMFHFVLAYFIFELVYAHWLLWKAMVKSHGEHRSQIKYILIGIFIGFVSGCTNYPLWYNIPIPPYLNIFVSGFVICVGYAIIRHRLLDIEVIVKKTLVFAGLFAASLALFILPILFIQEFMFSHMSFGGRILSLSISALLIILTLEPLKNYLEKVTNKFLFQKKYDPLQEIGIFIDRVSTILDLGKLINETMEILTKIFHPQGLFILLLNDGKDKYVSYVDKDKPDALSVANGSAIVDYLITTRNILSIEDESNKKITDAIKSEMIALKVTLAVPLILRDELIGIILMGKKKSDEYYAAEDLNMLRDLSRTLAIAVNNSVSHSLLLEAQKKEAQSERLVSMGYLVTNLSHEIRNPINNIALIAKDALDEIDFNLNLKDIPNQQQKDSISFVVAKYKDIIEKSQKANKVFNSILNIMKIDKKKFTPLDIKKIIDEDISRIAPSIKDTNIKVLNLIPDNFSSFKGDEIIIEQVFFNLINNAVQAIIVSHTGDKIEIKASDLGAKVRIEVIDNSCGIPYYDIDRVFEPFYTTKDNLHVYATGKSKGIGIGLMIAHHIVTAHDGTITVKSEEGKGADFIVEIPKEVKIEGA